MRYRKIYLNCISMPIFSTTLVRATDSLRIREMKIKRRNESCDLARGKKWVENNNSERIPSKINKCFGIETKTFLWKKTVNPRKKVYAPMFMIVILSAI